MAAYFVHIPKWVDREGGERGGYTAKCDLAGVIRAGKTPHPKLVERVYGDDAPKKVYHAAPHDRLLFRRSEGDYIIVPDVARNRDLWWPA